MSSCAGGRDIISRPPFFKVNIMKKSSFKIWQGKSPFNNAEIISIHTNLVNLSENPKTGPMSQIFILDANTPPYEKIKTGDFGSCGNCPLSPHKNNNIKCYVARRGWESPNSVWKAYRQNDIEFQESLLALNIRKMPIRFGSYGDPAMLPQDVFENIYKNAKNVLKNKTHTAYTHQFDNKFSEWIKKYALASVESLEHAEKMWDLGWRTFRITEKPEQSKHEIICLNYTKGIQCKDCCLCDGKNSNKDNRKSITIPRH